ncbi:hypothetical protein [Seonamhaeicola marinus]|uniref:DUF4760 domain-containing protein n=1 Tax=Seonamhaeicola marinus TaxID=1912246 RepID=A0A5D0HVR9_9FLAO|nr:hypothetical protein [Seonamhaeicola marinus]TYA74930.1 hypothetical protein FUA24_16655 [Seonamhaeicola marinus]
MKEFKDYLKTLFVPFLLISSIGLLTIVLTHLLLYFLFDYHIFQPEKTTDEKVAEFLNILTPAISIVGFLSIILTIVYTRKSILRELNSGTQELFSLFRSEKNEALRYRAWEVKQKWENEPGYKKKLIDYKYGEREETKNKKLNKDINSVFEILEFYLMLSNYHDNKQLFKSYRYFYYGWWRKFLYDIGGEIEKSRKCNENIRKSHPDYFKAISYTESLKRLDEICGFHDIPIDEEIHYDGG